MLPVVPAESLISACRACFPGDGSRCWELSQYTAAQFTYSNGIMNNGGRISCVREERLVLPGARGYMQMQEFELRDLLAHLLGRVSRGTSMRRANFAYLLVGREGLDKYRVKDRQMQSRTRPTGSQKVPGMRDGRPQGIGCLPVQTSLPFDIFPQLVYIPSLGFKGYSRSMGHQVPTMAQFSPLCLVLICRVLPGYLFQHEPAGSWAVGQQDRQAFGRGG